MYLKFKKMTTQKRDIPYLNLADEVAKVNLLLPHPISPSMVDEWTTSIITDFPDITACDMKELIRGWITLKIPFEPDQMIRNFYIHIPEMKKFQNK